MPHGILYLDGVSVSRESRGGVDVKANRFLAALSLAIMLAGTAVYALVWTRFVRRAPLFTPVPVEKILEQERNT